MNLFELTNETIVIDKHIVNIIVYAKCQKRNVLFIVIETLKNHLNCTMPR